MWTGVLLMRRDVPRQLARGELPARGPPRREPADATEDRVGASSPSSIRRRGRERTLVLVKPDGVERKLVGEVLGRIERKGLDLVALELRTVDRELADQHYAEHDGKPFFESLLEFITSGKVLAAVVEGPRAIRAFRQLAGGTDPVEKAAGHDPRRLRPGDAVQPRARLGLPGVGGPEIKLWFPTSDAGPADPAAPSNGDPRD